MDTDQRRPRRESPDTISDSPADGAAKASAIIGSDEFVERVRRAMTTGVRRAIEENAALQRRPKNPKL